VSDLIAPPYDVLDDSGKAALLDKNARNIVSIDLPHTPPKQLGPAQAYAAAGERYREWLEDGTLVQRERPAMFAYRQRFDYAGKAYARCGMCATLEALPLGPREGGGVLPHEETFSGPKEDRFALVKATAAQLSPIFGLHPDESGRASEMVRSIMDAGPADLTAAMGDGVEHEVWTVEDEQAIRSYQDALAGEDVFIADGHHRYTTGLNYLEYLSSQGPVGAGHPARRTMFVLVGMSDPGLAIGPTHRVLGGMSGYSLNAFLQAAEGVLEVSEARVEPAGLEAVLDKADPGVLGLIDFKTGTCLLARPRERDPLADRFADMPEAWRLLDVSIVQHLIVSRICEPSLNAGRAVRWAFPHTIQEAMRIGTGAETGAGGGEGFAQLAVIVRPTPLEAVRRISRAGVLMPQKSTYFYPKLATGLFVNPLS